jgi:hypothetical protein
MLQHIIEQHKNHWLASEECAIRPIITYIKQKGQLRAAQIEAIETYLFLKIKGQNKPLWQLVAEGFFANYTDDYLNQLKISQDTRHILSTNMAARALFELTRFKGKNVVKNNHPTLLPELEQHIINHTATINFEAVIKSIFYGISYTDYLFSLPMGAGKTFLMAAIIYIDLYFAINEPDNHLFAHNFIILIPSGLKSSIVPSLKSIAKFDPTWVIPEPVASKIKHLIKFEVLDQPKTARKSNKARNPNAQKINNHQPFDDLLGLVLVVNAEKVILDRIVLQTDSELIEKNKDEKDKQANELRAIIGKIPKLQIHIDEVHHAATDDIKLRQVVNKWHQQGTINSVLGYSGTPYLSSSEKINVDNQIHLKFWQITNTVFYYPLTAAIKQFLKKPRVEQAVYLEPLQIIEKGVTDFWQNYGQTSYQDGTCAKLAIYCGSIEKLEEQIYPFLVGQLKISQDLILKYHKGNKKYKLPNTNETEFATLDSPLSNKKIILLVQVGKEGWDCKSLAGIILSQKGDCPANMVLQTSCRCLRQADEGATALIWLNEDNAQILDKQLKDEQQTSINEINHISKNETISYVERFSRREHLRLPPIDFYQLQINYTTIIEEQTATPHEKLQNFSPSLYFNQALVVERNLHNTENHSKDYLSHIKGETAHFNHWLLDIVKGSFNTLSYHDLQTFTPELKSIFQSITFRQDQNLYFNDLYNQTQIQADIRLAFHTRRMFATKTEIIPESAQMLIIEQLKNVAENNLLYPDKNEAQKIRELDTKNQTLQISDEKAMQESYNTIIQLMESQGFGAFVANYTYEEHIAKNTPSLEVNSKDKTFHYLPYNFSQSAFELKFLKEVLLLKPFNALGLEIYYKGERELTDFRIMCYAKYGKNYRKIGLYTPDFLIIQRKNNQIYKILIIETKGSGFAEQSSFQLRKQFIEREFLQFNNEKFGYAKFDFLLLQDDQKLADNMGKLQGKVSTFFTE